MKGIKELIVLSIIYDLKTAMWLLQQVALVLTHVQLYSHTIFLIRRQVENLGLDYSRRET